MGSSCARLTMVVALMFACARMMVFSMRVEKQTTVVVRETQDELPASVPAPNDDDDDAADVYHHYNDDAAAEYTDAKPACFSCSSYSPLCRHKVYDAQYLSTVPCETACFVRAEANMTFRGCFDGWLGGIVDGSYRGCRVQEYHGKRTRWCFCDNTAERQGSPCNGASVDVLQMTSLPSQNDVNRQRQSDAISEEWVKRGAPTGKDPSRAQTGAKELPPHRTAYREAEPLSGLPPYKAGPLDDRHGHDNYNGASVRSSKTGPPSKDDVTRDEDSDDVTSRSRFCAGKLDGPHANPDDCSRYILCNHGFAYQMRCPFTTVWNQKLRACAFSYHASAPCKMPGTTSKSMRGAFVNHSAFFGRMSERQQGRRTVNRPRRPKVIKAFTDHVHDGPEVTKNVHKRNRGN